jgi:7-cyano-7-deazaguanine synthase
MLAIAYGVAVSEQAELVATAIHAGDHFIYPDCRPRFARLFDEMEAAATAGFARPNLHLHTPFIQRTKAEIVALGVELGVPFADTWSCYVGGPLHCGKCGTCVERKEAFVTAGVPDPTLYAESILA